MMPSVVVEISFLDMTEIIHFGYNNLGYNKEVW